MKKTYVLSIALLIIILVASFFIWKIAKHTPQANKVSSANKTKPLPKEVTITLSKTGFTPSQITVKTGSAVRWKNESGAQQTVNSDNYPTNQLHKELNFGVFSNNSSVVYTFTKPGTYGYHNQFHHEQKGKIIVTK